jgi:hypothetical protein
MSNKVALRSINFITSKNHRTPYYFWHLGFYLFIDRRLYQKFFLLMLK